MADNWSAEIDGSDCITRVHPPDQEPDRPIEIYTTEILRLFGIAVFVGAVLFAAIAVCARG